MAETEEVMTEGAMMVEEVVEEVLQDVQADAVIHMVHMTAIVENILQTVGAVQVHRVVDLQQWTLKKEGKWQEWVAGHPMVEMEIGEKVEAEVTTAIETDQVVLAAVQDVQAATDLAAAVLLQTATVGGVHRAVRIVLVHPVVDLQPCLKKK
jgi:hypothetical protein